MRSAVSSRSSSTTSVSSSTKSAYKDLDITAKAILTSLCNERNFEAATQYISPLVIIQHEDNNPVVSRDAFFHSWSQALQRMPNFQIEIKEACVDEIQRKVWVRSEIFGLPNGIRKESIDMMSFDEDGLLSSSVDSQRVIRSRGNDD